MTSHCSRKLFIRPSMSHRISRWRRAERWREELRRVLIFRLGNVGLVMSWVVGRVIAWVALCKENAETMRYRNEKIKTENAETRHIRAT
jgi:hypothetical protein